MSSARLSEAAELLRERASTATPGPWKSWGMDLLSDPVGNSNVDDGIPVVRGLTQGERPRTFNIDYIAMMAPPVALALADWLDEVANRDGAHYWRGIKPALAICDAILGDPS